MAVKFKSKQEIVDRLKKQIEVKDSTAIHALTFIYDRQAEDERRHEVVRYNNGMGFKPQDAKKGSGFAKWYLDKGFLTEKQVASVKKLVVKYACQIVEAKICAGEIQKVKHGEWVWN